MREYELEILEQYDIEVKSTRRIRGAFLRYKRGDHAFERGSCLGTAGVSPT